MTKPFEFYMEAGDNVGLWDDLAEFEWVEVNGGKLDQPILIRLARTNDNRVVINGLVIGHAFPHAPITADTLRNVQPATMLQQLLGDFSLGTPAPGDFSSAVEWGLMQELQLRLDYTHSATPGETRRAPESQLEDFARAYKEELVKAPHRAMTAAAERSQISRATANRWAKRAKELGYL